MPHLTPSQIHTRPPAALVAAVRESHGFTQVQCSAIIACTPRSWASYEARNGAMPLSAWWLFLLRISEIHESHLMPIPPRQRASTMIHVKTA